MPTLGSGAPWWHLFPDRLDEELRLLDAAGIEYVRDHEAEASGLLRLDLSLAGADGAPLRLHASFPDFYPFFRFEIEAPELDLEYHQQPFHKVLCFLARGTEHWRPASDRLASFLIERLPLVLDTAPANAPAAVVGLEARQAEPFSDYYTYEAPSIALADGGWEIDAHVGSGWLTLGVASPANSPLQGPFTRGAILEVRDNSGRVLAVADPALSGRFPCRFNARWVRLSSPLRLDSARDLYRAIEAADPEKGRGQLDVPFNGNPAGGPPGTLRVRVALYPVEAQWRGDGLVHADQWLVTVRAVETSLQSAAGRRGSPQARQTPNMAFRAAQRRIAADTPHELHYVIRPGRVGRADVLVRAPELLSMTHASVALVGLGCLGAPSALEFARAQVGSLAVADFDTVDPGTLVRWPFGLIAAGLTKTETIETVVRENFPYTKIRSHTLRIGGLGIGAPHQGEELSSLLHAADLLYDASAEPGVRYFLSEVARERDMTYVGVAAAQGGWGGWIFRVRPQVTEGCYICLEHARAEPPDSPYHIPSPFAAPDNAGRVQPVGCGDPTFTAANFDVTEVALMGVRMAVGALTRGAAGAYPDGGWDVAVLKIRDESGALIAPVWSTHPLRRHPACPACAARAEAA